MKKHRSMLTAASALVIAAALAFTIALAGGCAAGPGESPMTETGKPEANNPQASVPAETAPTETQPAVTEPTVTDSAMADPIVSDSLFGNFTTVDLEGNQVGPEIFAQYDLTMVNIWGTYCGPCISEMPELGELSEEYASRGLGIVGIVIDGADYEGNPVAEGIESAKALVEKTQANYLHILPSADLIESYLSQVQALPTTVFLDADGIQVGKTYLGSKDKNGWMDIIDELLPEVSLPG